MQTTNFTSRTHRRYRRFWRFFRRQKPAVLDITYSFENMMRFPRLPITVPPLVPTLMSYRWNDEDDCHPSPKKCSHDHHYEQQQHIRRRIPKRYSDIVGPAASKAYLPRKDSMLQEKQTIIPSSQRNHRRASTKANPNEHSRIIHSHNKKTAEILSSLPKLDKKEHPFVTRRYNSKNKRLSTGNAVDLLAHRMQAAMSTELMHSLDRNFVFGDKKHLANYLQMNRSHSFNIPISPSNDWWNQSPQKLHHYHMIPRVKCTLDDEQKSIDEPTPDYDEEIVIKRMSTGSNVDMDEEPIADYDDVNATSTAELEDKLTMDDLGVSSSAVALQTSTSSSKELCTQEEESSTPPIPPPLPTAIIEQKKTTFRCRTIADKISADHKLILKDEMETRTIVTELALPTQTERQKKPHQTPPIVAQPVHMYLSKELLQKTTLRKVSHPVSRSYSTYGSMSLLNDHDTESTTLRGKTTSMDEQPLDGLSSSATTSIIIENEYEHRSSSKIYNDYKRRASSINVPNNDTQSHCSIIHPIHTHIGLRSSTSSSSTNDKASDMTLSNKQMNVCVINQLNEHLSTRFRQHQEQQEIYISKDTTVQQSYDQPPDIITNKTQNNVYDEPHKAETTKKTPIKGPTGSIPPPPPPLPVGGFRSFIPPSSSQRTSIATLARETNGFELGCSTGTSTTSSKLSDTQILRELRTNPLFTKAKQHLELDPGSHGRRSGRRLNETVSYLRLDTCSKSDLSHNLINDHHQTNMKTFMMHTNELSNAVDKSTKRTKSMNNSRTFTNSLLQTKCRQSELELIFQKRAQRIEQNLT